MPQNIKQQIIDTINKCPNQRLEMDKLNKLFNFGAGKETLQQMLADGELLMFRDRRREVIVNTGDVIHHKTMHSAGADVFATEETVIPAGERVLVPTSFIANQVLDENEVAILSPRSSFFKPEKNRKLLLTNSIGIIDPDYPEIAYFSYFNVGADDVVIEKGEDVGQVMLLKPVVSKFPTYMRERTGGFGSTDKSAEEVVDEIVDDILNEDDNESEVENTEE